jgi:hypothetical protein
MEERVFNCPDCGVEVRTKYPRTLRCKVCAEKKRRETRNNWTGRKKPMTDADYARRAHRVAILELETCDSLENVQKCLNCKKKKCNNCLSLQVSTRGEKDDA